MGGRTLNVLLAHVLSMSVLVPYLFVRKARCKKKESELETKDGFNVTLDDLSTISDDIRFQREINFIGVRQGRLFVYMSILITILNVIFMIIGFVENAPYITFLGGLGISTFLIWITSEIQDEVLADIKDVSKKLQLYADEEHQVHGRFVSDPIEYMILKENVKREAQIIRLIQEKQNKISEKKTTLNMLEAHEPTDIIALAKLEKKWKKQKKNEMDSKSKIEKWTKEITEVLTDKIPSKWEHVTRSFERKKREEEIHQSWHRIQLVKEAERLIRIAKQEI